jgi:hypothetical protein
MPKGSKAMQGCVVVLAGFGHQDQKDGTNWATNLGARISSKVDSGTTHVIASQAAWVAKQKNVESALKENEARQSRGAAEIKIVTMQWLEDSSWNRTKKSEGSYLWQKMPKKRTKATGQASSKTSTGVEGPKNAAGMMTETLMNATEQHVDEDFNRSTEKEKKRLQKQKDLEEQARQEQEAEDQERERKKQRHQEAEVFQKGAKKARNELFSGAHRAKSSSRAVDSMLMYAYEQKTSTYTPMRRTSNTTSS